MTSFLITGAAGFIGFHLARTLADRPDARVIAVDNFVRGERDQALRALADKPNVTFIEADLTREDAVAGLPDDIDIVFHMAALNGTQNFYERPMDVIRCSTLPTILLVERFGRIGLTRMVYAGTSESYASTVTRFGWPVPTAEDVVLSIDGVENPRWSYAASKMHGEVVTAQGGKSYGFPWSIIRYHNVYGPRMGDRHVVPDFFERMREGRYELFGHEDTRSFLYIDDAVRATLAVGETPECAGQIVNVGSVEEITIRELGQRMLAARGLHAEMVLHPSPSGSVRRRAPDISKLRRLTGFEQRISLDEGLAATARFYLDGELMGVLGERAA
ncbi:MAG TPA: NAD-dependent epimerase/dehydratase family protein [Croceibacterium sp.]